MIAQEWALYNRFGQRRQAVGGPGQNHNTCMCKSYVLTVGMQFFLLCNYNQSFSIHWGISNTPIYDWSISIIITVISILQLPACIRPGSASQTSVPISLFSFTDYWCVIRLFFTTSYCKNRSQIAFRQVLALPKYHTGWLPPLKC